MSENIYGYLNIINPLALVLIWLYLTLLISSGGKECQGDLQYYPFRMTPYLMKVQDTVHAEDQFCCLLLAERVHSGYDGEAPHTGLGSQF